MTTGDPGSASGPSPQQGREHDREVMARNGGLMFLGGATLSPLAVVVPNASGGRALAILAMGGAAALTGALMAAFPRKVPGWALALLVPFGTTLITAVMKLNGIEGVGTDTQILYVLVTLYAFYFLSPRAAFAQLGLVGVAYGWLLLSELPADNAIARWLTTASVLLAAGLLVQRMNSRVDGLIDALRVSARRDALTGVLNRRGFDERFALELTRARRTREPLSLLMLDLDRFKRLNDSRGHVAGDDALRRVAALLAESARDVDAVGRIGGEEFAVLVAGSGGPLARRIAERLHEQVANEFADWQTPLTISIGVASAPPLEARPGPLIRAADDALYRAKDLGRNRTVVADDPEFDDELALV